MSELTNASFNIQVREYVALTPGAARERSLQGIFAVLVRSETLAKWARSMANHSNYRDQSGVEDIQQVISEKLFVTLSSATAENTSRVGDWLNFLHGTAQRAVQDYLASGQVSVASGMSGAARRRSIISRTRRELVTKLDREPTNAEIIEAANTWARAHHKDARKQGLLLNEEDFAAISMAALSLDESPSAAPSVMNDTETYSEALLALRRLRATAEAMFPSDEDLHRVVVAWAECVSQGERPTQEYMSKHTRLRPTAIRSAMVRLNDVLGNLRGQYSV